MLARAGLQDMSKNTPVRKQGNKTVRKKSASKQNDQWQKEKKETTKVRCRSASEKLALKNQSERLLFDKLI